MKAIVISASKLDKDLKQKVTFNIVHGDDDQVLLSHTIEEHVDQVRSKVTQFTQEWGTKYLEATTIQEGEVLEA